MSTERFHIVYDGLALAEHRMDVRDLAPALVAIGNLATESNRVLNGDAADIRVEVHASFKAGSFGIEMFLSQDIVKQITDIFSGQHATALANIGGILGLIGLTGGGLFTLLKTLRGRVPVKVDVNDNGSATLWITETESIIVEDHRIVELYRSREVRLSVDKLLSPLETDGIDSFGVVKSDQVQQSVTADELRAIVSRKKQIEELRLSLTRPLDESKKRIMDLFRQPTDRLEQAESLLRKGITTYQQAERAKQEALRREAEEKQRQEREAQRKLEEAARREAEEARASGDLEAAQAAEAAQAEAQEAIELADIAPLLPAVEVQKVVGISARQTWKAEVVNIAELVKAAAAGLDKGDNTLLALLNVNTVALNQIAKALKAQANIPGVRVYAEESLSVRGAA